MMGMRTFRRACTKFVRNGERPLLRAKKHVFAPQRLQHLRPGEAGDLGQGEHAEGQRGQDGGGGGAVDLVQDGEPPRLEAEVVEQDEGEHEGGDAHAQHGYDGAERVRDGVVAQRGQHPQQQAKAGSHTHGLKADADGDGQARPDHLGHRNVLLDVVGNAQVAGHHPPDVSGEANQHRAVQPVLFSEDRHLLRTQLFVVEGRAWHQLQHEEEGQNNGEERGRCGQHPFDNVCFHDRIP